jgi:hypothetical protein
MKVGEYVLNQNPTMFNIIRYLKLIFIKQEEECSSPDYLRQSNLIIVGLPQGYSNSIRQLVPQL